MGAQLPTMQLLVEIDVALYCSGLSKREMETVRSTHVTQVTLGHTAISHLNGTFSLNSLVSVVGFGIYKAGFFVSL